MLFSPQLIVPPPRRIVAAGGSFTTWNPADKGADITLSNGNLTATSSAGDGVRSIASHSSGKFYCEGVFTKGSNISFGIANATESLSNFVGQSNNSIGSLSDDRVFLSLVQVGTAAVISNGQTWCMAVDFGNQTIYFRNGGGIWNNNGSADPAANTGGFSFATMAAGPYFVMFGPQNNGDAAAMNFGATAYSQTAPSGFGNW